MPASKKDYQVRVTITHNGMDLSKTFEQSQNSDPLDLMNNIGDLINGQTSMVQKKTEGKTGTG